MSYRIWLIIPLLAVGVGLANWIHFGREEDRGSRNDITSPISEALSGSDAMGFTRAYKAREFIFPEDHGPHGDYKHEWWYFTGNLETNNNKHLGFQLTFFRIGLTPEPRKRASAWATNQVYMAHFTVSDVANGRFYNFERFSRGAAGLAGASGEPFRVWIEDWFVEREGDPGSLNVSMKLHAAEDDVAIDLKVDSIKPIVLQGERGLSRKSAEPGNASYYYSFPRLSTAGTIRLGKETFTVDGLSWMDREWSTSALDKDQVGWDWFALQLSDGRDLMFYRLRRRDSTADPFSRGALVTADGSMTPLMLRDVEIRVLDYWQSPQTRIRYPARWHVRVPKAALDLDVRPYLSDQELDVSVRYWEGAVKVTGISDGEIIGGSGYVELVGYGGDAAN